ncbi:MAG: flagellar basal body P-ring formation chaperone FlgA [Pseudomonadota bacterium]
MRYVLALACGLFAALSSPDTMAGAETVVASRTLRADTLVGYSDVALKDGLTPGALSQLEDAVGLEVKRNVYAGQPILPSDLGPPAILLRNDTVVLSYYRGGLAIVTEGRVLGRAGIGESVRVMNLSSRNSVTGTVLPDGSVEVTGPGGLRLE